METKETFSKIMFLGDGYVGKTSFLMTYATKTFPTDYIPTSFDDYNDKIIIDGKNINLGLWDFGSRSSGDERLRPLMYPQTDCFILFFSVVNPDSLENLKRKWIPEFQHHNINVPFIIVGTKIDLREDLEFLKKLSQKGLTPISYQSGKQFAKEVGAYDYIETSAKLNIGLIETITKAAEATLNPNSNRFSNVKSQQRNCILL